MIIKKVLISLFSFLVCGFVLSAQQLRTNQILRDIDGRDILSYTYSEADSSVLRYDTFYTSAGDTIDLGGLKPLSIKHISWGGDSIESVLHNRFMRRLTAISREELRLTVYYVLLFNEQRDIVDIRILNTSKELLPYYKKQILQTLKSTEGEWIYTDKPQKWYVKIGCLKAL